MRSTDIRSPAWREALLALVVLALAFLSFGHTSAVFAAGGRVVVTAHSVCGDPGAIPAAGDHFACHGCKPDLALLPPRPAAAARLAFATASVIYPTPVEAAAPTLLRRLGQPRAPPAI